MSGYSPILELGDDPHPLTPREKVVFKQPCDHCQRMTTVDLTALASGSGDHAELSRLAEAATARLAGPSLSADDFGYQIWGDSQKGGDTHVLDVRGWGYLTGKGAGALGLSDAEAMSAQRAIQRYAVAAWNAVPALLAEVAALRGERDRNWEEYLAERQARMDHGSREAGYLDQIDKLNSRATEAERKLAEADQTARQIVGLQIPPGDDPDQRLKLLSLLARAQVLARSILSKEAERG